MKKVLPVIGKIVLIMILELSWSGFISSGERPFFFLFSFLALSVLQRGFIPALPMNILTLIVFEGVIRSTVGSLSLYGILFSYSMSFLLKRFHLEDGGEKIILALVAGTGMALSLPIISWYDGSFQSLLLTTFSPFAFAENIAIGAIIFLIMLRIFSRFRREVAPLPASSFR